MTYCEQLQAGLVDPADVWFFERAYCAAGSAFATAAQPGATALQGATQATERLSDNARATVETMVTSTTDVAKKVASPLGLASLGFGGAVGTVLVGVVGGVVVDQVFFGGAGRASLLSMVRR